MAETNGDVAVESAVAKENVEKVESPVKEIKSEPSEQEQKIIRQVEYYYGDLNLVRDKFLQEQIKEDNGWVSVETMLKFNRLATLSPEAEVIVAALRKAKSGLMEGDRYSKELQACVEIPDEKYWVCDISLEFFTTDIYILASVEKVNEDGSKMRRSPDKPLPDFTKDRNKDLKNRTVYAKGFPLDVNLDALLEFFDKFGSSEQIFMRRDKEKKFKGSVFVTFHEEEGATKFLEAENLKYGETELVRFKKEDYFRSKESERKKHRDDRVKDKDTKSDKTEGDAESDEEDDDSKFSITRGAILELKNIPADVTREDLKTLLGGYATIGWQDFTKGQEEGKIRFEDEDGAKVAWEKATEAGDGKVQIKDTTLEGRVLEGDEEVAHWKAIRESQKAQRNRMRERGRRGGRGGGSRRGGRGGYRGRGGGGGHRRRGSNDGEGGPPQKVQKTE